jgi:hypothetical protein
VLLLPILLWPQVAHCMAVRMGYGVRDGFAGRSEPTLWWASYLDLDQSIGEAARAAPWSRLCVTDLFN